MIALVHKTLCADIEEGILISSNEEQLKKSRDGIVFSEELKVTFFNPDFKKAPYPPVISLMPIPTTE